MQLNGLHHVTAITARISENLDFYTGVLGLRLVKKTVNQDDVSAYHLFYADKNGSPGTDMTFFDWPDIDEQVPGTDSITTTIFRVGDVEALDYWGERFTRLGVSHLRTQIFGDREALFFSDPEGQRMMLLPDGGAPFEGEPWEGSDVPVAYALRGFYAVLLSVASLKAVDRILSGVLMMHRKEAKASLMGKSLAIYEMAEGGPGRELWLLEEPDLPQARQGAGGIHHVAFRVADIGEQQAFFDQLRASGVRSSSLIDRYYFSSLYFRISPGILFEIATDGPGFSVDEEADSLGLKLVLPPFLEGQREQIEAGLKPLG